MKASRILTAIAVFLLSAAVTSAFGTKEKDDDTQTVQITGKVRLVGSSPRNNLVITNEDREWIIEEKEQQKLWQLQQQIVTVTGKESFRDLRFANGNPAGRQYYLKDIKIITEEDETGL